MWIAVGSVIAGVFAGALLVWLVMRARRASEEQLKGTFANLSRQALQENADQLVQRAKDVLGAQTDAAQKELDGKKQLIDQNLTAVSKRLREVQEFLQKVDKEREGSHRALASQLQSAAEQTAKLSQTTEELNRALAGSQHRGQWGERIAEDVLRLAGFIEDVNYVKQQQIETGATRPDFTFPLPNGLKLNMDVKFPLANYRRYVEAETDADRARFGKAFISDVKNRVKEAATRDYINPAENTVDYALVFIPNEQVYSSIHELDATAIDDALRRKIVLCSPLTLYAVLAVIRQAAENIAMERQAVEMANLISAFMKQWENYKAEFAKLGSQLETVQRTYGRLERTRTNQLERPVDKINELRSAQGELPAPDRDTEPR